MLNNREQAILKAIQTVNQDYCNIAVLNRRLLDTVKILAKHLLEANASEWDEHKAEELQTD